jgi:hypothetical protein
MVDMSVYTLVCAPRASPLSYDDEMGAASGRKHETTQESRGQACVFTLILLNRDVVDHVLLVLCTGLATIPLGSVRRAPVELQTWDVGLPDRVFVLDPGLSIGHAVRDPNTPCMFEFSPAFLSSFLSLRSSQSLTGGVFFWSNRTSRRM